MAADLADLTTHMVSTEDPTTYLSGHENIVYSINPVLRNFQYINISIRFLMGLLAINNNLLTVVAIGRYEYLRSCTNYIIAALAIGDLIGGLTCLLLFINYLTPMTDETWLKMCAVEFTLSQVSAGLNLTYILLISMDRFIFITFPLRYHSLVTPKLTIGAILVPCIALTIHFTVVHLDPEGYNMDIIVGRICYGIFPPRINFQINMWFYLTTPWTVLLYTRIAWIAYRQSRVIEQTQAPDANTKKEYKITKMLSLVLGVYFACYLPFMAIAAIHSNGRDNDVVIVIISRACSWIWWVNAWVNPFIYAWKNKNFNRAFRSLLGLKSPAVDPMQGNVPT